MGKMAGGTCNLGKKEYFIRLIGNGSRPRKMEVCEDLAVFAGAPGKRKKLRME